MDTNNRATTIPDPDAVQYDSSRRVDGPDSIRSIRVAASKVPEVTAWFWAAKILTTGMGETASDFLTHLFEPEIAVALGATALLISLAVQFRVRRYIPWVYWTAVAMVSVSGTMAADALHAGLEVPYIASTIFFAAALATVFILWQRTEMTLSIHTITSRRRELFYWASVMTTFALGTAAGDMTAHSLNLGYLTSGMMFTAAIAVPAAAYRRRLLPAIPAFWFAYILTRPLGASFADWTAVTADHGGLNWGAGPVTLALTGAIIAVVTFLTLARKPVVGLSV
jgi:uncharacterized membrane-anchored protein